MKRSTVAVSTILILGLLFLITASCCFPPPCYLGPGLSGTSGDATIPENLPPATTTPPDTTTQPATDVAWIYDYQAGLDKAAQDGKPVLLDFWGGG